MTIANRNVMMAQVWPCLCVANSQLWWIHNLYFYSLYVWLVTEKGIFTNVVFQHPIQVYYLIL